MKTKNRSFLITILFLLLSLTNCQVISVPDKFYDNIFGKWDWVQTTNIKTGEIETPKSKGLTRSVKFGKYGGYLEYLNNVQGINYKFSFGRKIKFRDNEGYQLIIENTPISKEARWTENVILLNKKTLIIDDNSDYNDIISLYIKE